MSAEEEAQKCPFCDNVVRDGDGYHGTSEGELVCLDCAPTYGDLLRDPESFLDANDEPMTQERAKELCDAHVASGGSLDDKVVA